MRYTIRNVPATLDRAIRSQAERDGRSLNETIIQQLMIAFGLAGEPVRRRDLGDIVGSWVEDPAIDEALSAQC